MRENLYIGFDLGTSNIKAVLVDQQLLIRASSEKEVAYIPNSDKKIKEIDPEQLFSLICDMLRELANSAKNNDDIKAVCFSGATGNTMLLDKNHRPLTNIISWLDTRTVESELTAEEVYPVSGWPVSEIFPVAHISWWRKYRPKLFRHADRIVMNNDYITYRLTGNFVLDYSTASTFILFNQEQKKWHRPFLEKFAIKENQLSEPISSGSLIGTVTEEIVAKTGLAPATAIVTGSFDHPSAALACDITNPGDLLLSCGTSWVGFYPLKNRSGALAQKMLIDPFLSENDNGCWGGIFSIPKVGAIFDEWVTAIWGKLDYKTFDKSAARAPSGADGLKIDIVESYTAEEKQQIIKKNKPENICRALMESTAKMMKGKIATFADAGIRANNITIVGGPTKSVIWLKILSDTLEREINIHKSGQYAGAIGAAMYAKLYFKRLKC